MGADDACLRSRFARVFEKVKLGAVERGRIAHVCAACFDQEYLSDGRDMRIVKVGLVDISLMWTVTPSFGRRT